MIEGSCYAFFSYKYLPKASEYSEKEKSVQRFYAQAPCLADTAECLQATLDNSARGKLLKPLLATCGTRQIPGLLLGSDRPRGAWIIVKLRGSEMFWTNAGGSKWYEAISWRNRKHDGYDGEDERTMVMMEYDWSLWMMRDGYVMLGDHEW